MNRASCAVRLAAAAAIAAAMWACADSTAPGGGGNGGPAETDYEIPPFKVVQNGIDFEGASGQIAAGLDGVVLATASIWGDWIVPTGDRTDLYAVWSRSVDSFFVVGDRGADHEGVIYRYAGGRKARMTHPLDGWLTGICGSSWNRVYAVGSDGGIIRHTGSGWSLVHEAAGALHDVWVSREGDVWAVGGGTVLHFDGASWRDLSAGVAGSCRAVAGVSPDTVYVALDDQVWRFHQPVGAEPAGEMLFDSGSGYAFLDIDASDHGWIMAVGEAGRTARYEGAGWTMQTLALQRLTSVSTGYSIGLKAAAVYGHGGTAFLYYDGSWTMWSLSTGEDWTDMHGAAGTTDVLYGIRGGDLMRFGFGATPERWLPYSAVPSVALERLFCTGADAVWATGASTDPYAIDRFAYFYSGGTWTSYWLSSMSDPRDLWCEDGDRVCIVGDDASVWYRTYDVHAGWIFNPTQAITPPEDLHGVWGWSMTNLYAVGDNGTIVRSDDGGAHWTAMTSGTAAHLRDISGWAAGRAVAVGDGGTALYLDGGAWSAMSTGVTEDLSCVWCDGYNDYWAAGGTTVLHWDGSVWERWDTALPVAPVRAVCGSDGRVWFACERDFVLEFQEPIW